ncbi:hypothetical protein [Bacillus sp. 1P06AnD]|uniref:hypothetical protein n=1 Tax=Bacillus sp. 1P06AnD TaxID=3132208 RepID=UPI0039A33156
MREKPYLLIYNRGGEHEIEWFRTEDELDLFIEQHQGIEIIEGIFLKQAETIRGFKRRG